MRENMKKHLAVFLSILFILPTIMSVLPMTSQEVQAGVTYMGWNMTSYNNSISSRVIAVEAGQQFNIGDFVMVYGGSSSTIASMVKTSYKSNKTSVATVDSKGVVKAKKIGKATITIKYKGQKLSCIVNVEKAGSFGEKDIIASAQNEVDALVKNLPSKVTGKNGFSLLKKKADYYKKMTDYTDDYAAKISYDGFLKENYSTTSKLAVPDASKYYRIQALLTTFGQKNSPTSTRSAKVLKVKSLSGKTSGITMKLNKAVTSDQILASNIENSYYNQDTLNQNTSKSYITVYDKTAGNKWYSGMVTLKKGSRSATLVLTEYKFSGGAGKYVKVKLKKGHTYQIGSSVYWTKGKTVKVK